MFSTRRSSFHDYRSHLPPANAPKYARKASRISRTVWELHSTSSHSLLSLSLSYSYIFVCTRKRTHRDTTCIRIQTKACPVIIALLGYWTPNHEVTTVSNRALLAPGAFTLVYVSINANYFASLLPNSNLSSLSTLFPSFFLPSPFAVSLVLHNHLLLLLLFPWNENLESLSTPFQPEEKKKRNETRHFSPSLSKSPIVFILSFLNYPPFHPLASQAPNTSRQLHFQSNRYLAAILRSIGTSIYASSLKRDTKRFYTPSGFISSLLGMHLGHRPSLNDTNGR